MLEHTLSHEEQDRILDSASALLSTLSSDYELQNPSIEKWRWDIPDVMLKWQGYDDIHRNINIFLAETENYQESPSSYVIVTEANAWTDTFHKTDSGMIVVRRWTHETVQKIPGYSNGKLKEAVYKAYHVAAEWTSDDLTRVAESVLPG